MEWWNAGIMGKSSKAPSPQLSSRLYAGISQTLTIIPNSIQDLSVDNTPPKLVITRFIRVIHNPAFTKQIQASTVIPASCRLVPARLRCHHLCSNIKPMLKRRTYNFSLWFILSWANTPHRAGRTQSSPLQIPIPGISFIFNLYTLILNILRALRVLRGEKNLCQNQKS